jgi:predicted nucleic acid-binding protein
LTLIVDSFAWVEFLTGGPFGPDVRTKFEESGDLLTPDFVLAEISRALFRGGGDPKVIEGYLRTIQALSTVVAVDLSIALEVPRADQDLRRRAARRRTGAPSFADAIVLAIARRAGGKVLTGDRHFEGLPETVWVGD